MENYIPYRILVITNQVQQDPVLWECFRRAFDWANKMGLEGKRVGNLTLEDSRSSDPLNQRIGIWCQVECTEEEYRRWEEMKKARAYEHMVSNFDEDQ